MTPTALPLRWYLARVRLLVAQALLLPVRELASRAFALAAAVLLVVTVFSAQLAADAPAPKLDGVTVVGAWVQFVWQVVIMIVAALISYALRPKPKPPEAQKANIPVAQDGKGIRRIYGTVWIDDSVVLGFKQLGTTPIKAKGGKK